MKWTDTLHRRREAAVRRLARIVSGARATMTAREGAIATQLHRADHMLAGKGRCGSCAAAAELRRVQADGWDRLEADVRAGR